MACYEICGLKKSYHLAGKEVSVLQGLNLFLEDGSFTVVAGRSGCGKTTLLRLLAGLEQSDSGTIKSTGSGRIGMVFQEPRLMPWLNVEENIALAMERPDSKRIAELMAAVRLNGFEKAKPHALSGGMQHRAALARALAHDPDVLLMDEPFAALDYFTRLTMQELLVELYQRTRLTVVFVTHSIDEALLLGKRVVVLEDGNIGADHDLSAYPYPRDVSQTELLALRRQILDKILKNGERGSL